MVTVTLRFIQVTPETKGIDFGLLRSMIPRMATFGVKCFMLAMDIVFHQCVYNEDFSNIF